MHASESADLPATLACTHVICAPHVPWPLLACVFQISSVHVHRLQWQAGGGGGDGSTPAHGQKRCQLADETAHMKADVDEGYWHDPQEEMTPPVGQPDADMLWQVIPCDAAMVSMHCAVSAPGGRSTHVPPPAAHAASQFWPRPDICQLMPVLPHCKSIAGCDGGRGGGGDGGGGFGTPHCEHSGVSACAATCWHASDSSDLPATLACTHVICAPHVP